MEKLSEVFKNGNYESKSSCLTELIEDGLVAREQTEQKRNELDTENVKIAERLFALENQWAEFAKTVYSELKALRKERDITHRALGAVYNLLEAINSGDIILAKELESGYYDILPMRFKDSA